MTSPVPFSLLTITSGRDGHLRNVIAGINRMDVRPSEIVIAYMNQSVHPDLDTDVPIRSIDVRSTSGLPLARARNAAARASAEEMLMFLDVDCVPAVDFGSTLAADLENFGGLVMGTPLYLPPDSSSFDDATPHRIRKELRPGPQTNIDLFWSLCFAITKSDFESVSGFDESFMGYGAEDTDFARSSERHGLSFTLSDATVFHQHHASYRPPLNHFRDIVANALVFKQKWGSWPMEGWLAAFVDRGLIIWSADAEAIEVLREPTGAEISAALVDQT